MENRLGQLMLCLLLLEFLINRLIMLRLKVHHDVLEHLPSSVFPKLIQIRSWLRLLANTKVHRLSNLHKPHMLLMLLNVA